MNQVNQIPTNVKGLGNFAGAPSTDQLRLYFQLTDFDRDLIKEMRSAATQLGFAVQLGSVRFLGTFPNDLQQVPQAVIDYLASQLSLSALSFTQYTRRMTISQHQNLIRQRYHYCNFTDPTINQSLTAWLLKRAKYTNETNQLLSDMLLKKCLDEKILLPGITTFERFVSQTIELAADQTDQAIAAIPTVREVHQLRNLLTAVETPVYGATIRLDVLRKPLMDESRKEIQRGFQRLRQFGQFPTETWQLATIPEGKLKQLAKYAFNAKASLIKRMNPTRQTALLVAFVYEYRKRAMDEQLLALSRFYETLFKRAKNKETKERMRTLKDLDQAALPLAKIVGLVLDDTIDQQALRPTILRQYGPDNIQSAVTQVNQLVHNDEEPIAIEELLTAYRKFRKFIPDILATITFAGTHYGQDSLTVWRLIEQRFPRPITYSMFQSIEAQLPKKWRYYINQHPNLTNQCVLIAGIEQLMHGLKRHDIYVTQSERYTDPMACLIDQTTWQSQKAILIQQLNLPETGSAAVEMLETDLNLSYQETLKNWPDSAMARIEQVGGHDKIVVAKLRKTREHKDEAAFRNRVRRLIPKIDLSDLLLEMNQQLQLTHCFTHLNAGETKMKHVDISILAVLLAEACNIGLSPVAKKTDRNLKHDRLLYVDHQYLRLDTLSAANHRIIKAHRQLKTAQIWGDGQMASADGIRYVTPQRSLYSRSNPKYFGRGRGITFYNFVSDQYIGFHGMVVAGTLRDSLYLLEGFLNQTSDLEPQQIMTDTAGYSDLVFGLFGLLGFQFSPRIANNQGTKLWRCDPQADYQILNGVSQNRINRQLIADNWDDILRVAGSLKSGKVNATELTQALQREGHPTQLGKAITEYGKVYKTKHQLRYLSDEGYARQILEQLNKGEARHALCRNIFYGRKGKLYQTYFDGMEEQLNALSLVTNAIIYWNTVYMEAIIAKMKTEGYQCDDEMIGKLSPLMFEHINFIGQYTFQYDEALADGQLRPLDTLEENS
ncbi:MAG: Tn3 family transposase [Lactiplantibacillus plantarum]|nr:Tn3 family transposase [Lactiplantibacillus plantarum]